MELNLEKMEKQINEMRKRINRIDKSIILLLEERMDISKRIGKIKMKNKLNVRDIKRENEIIDHLLQTSNFDKKFIKKIFYKIFEESRRIQR